MIQIDQIFTNVSKGQLASDSDLLVFANIHEQQAAPPPQPFAKQSKANTRKKQQATKSSSVSSAHAPHPALNQVHHQILMEILKNGELQVSEKERQEELNEKRKEIANLVSEKTLDPLTNRPHTISMIEKAMDTIHFSVNLSKSSKIQALDLIKILTDRPEVISLRRNQMRIRLVWPNGDDRLEKLLRANLISLFYEVEEDRTSSSDQSELVGLIDPSQFKVINEFIQDQSLAGQVKIETLSLSAQQIVQGDQFDSVN